MPVQHVHLHGGEPDHDALQLLDREVLPGGVDEYTSVRKARGVDDVPRPPLHYQSVRRQVARDELRERGQAVHGAEHVLGAEGDGVGSGLGGQLLLVEGKQLRANS